MKQLISRMLFYRFNRRQTIAVSIILLFGIVITSAQIGYHYMASVLPGMSINIRNNTNPGDAFFSDDDFIVSWTAPAAAGTCTVTAGGQNIGNTCNGQAHYKPKGAGYTCFNLSPSATTGLATCVWFLPGHPTMSVNPTSVLAGDTVEVAWDSKGWQNCQWS